jgi:hypothetical protein
VPGAITGTGFFVIARGWVSGLHSTMGCWSARRPGINWTDLFGLRVKLFVGNGRWVSYLMGDECACE